MSGAPIPVERADRTPLAVDLDGTLLRADLVQEGLLRYAISKPLRFPGLVALMLRDRAAAKRRMAEALPLRPELLPYDGAVMEEVRAARAAGRAVELVSGSDEIWVKAVAAHTGLFDHVAGSDGRLSLTGSRKAEYLARRFGEGGFDYAGNAWPDLKVWARARRALVSKPEPGLKRAAAARLPEWRLLPDGRPPLGVRLVKMVRLHQWTKNLLLFVPLFTGHMFTRAGMVQAAIGTLAFSLCAAAVYGLNDLVDLDSDRAHPRKKARPFASGALSVPFGLGVVPVLLACAFGLAAWLPAKFLLLLAIYFVVTCAYSFSLKRHAILDVMALSGLYVVRILAGGAAVGVHVSQWLLSFSMFLFASLAMVKRHSELAQRADAHQSAPPGRGYGVGDLDVLLGFAAAAGFNAVTILALYCASPDVRQLYARPERLWLLLPVVFYWIARVILLSHRRRMHYDPVVFALRDRVSLGCGAVALAVVAAAAGLVG